jgi:hypothetical protein
LKRAPAALFDGVVSVLIGHSVVMPTIVKSVVVTHLAGGFEGAVEIAADDRLRVFPLNTEHHLDTVMSKYFRGAWTHTSSQNHCRTLLAQPHWEYPAPMLRWGAEQALTDSATVLVNGVKGERLGAAEVLAEPSLVYWNRDFHWSSPPGVQVLSAPASPASAAALLVTATAALSPPAPAIVDRTGKGLVSSRHHRSLSHHQHPLLDQRSCNRRSGAGENAGESRAGDPHPFGRGLLVEPFEVGQAKGLELVQPQLLDLEGVDRATDRLECPPPGHATNSPQLFRSSHFAS